MDIIWHRQSLRFMPGSAVANQQDLIVGILFRERLEKGVHTGGIAGRHHQKMTVPADWINRAICVSVFPNMVAWHAGTYIFRTPTGFGLVYPSKSCFILKHDTDVLFCILYTKFLGYALNFFEASISASLAFFGCLDRGITLRHLCRFSTLYMYALPVSFPSRLSNAALISCTRTTFPASA